MDNRFDLAIAGLGYVGLPLAMAASSVGLRVLGVDHDPEKVAALKAGRSYIPDIPDAAVERALSAGFDATISFERPGIASAYSICVPTPLRDNVPDLSAVIAASEAVGKVLVPGDLVVLESTSYPGTTEEVVMPLLAEHSGLRPGEDFRLAFSPERIDPANSEWTIATTPRIVAGIDPGSTDQAEALYGKFCAQVVRIAGVREAELAKLLENTYRQVNIAFVNELAKICHAAGIDLHEAIRAAATKPFGFQAFFPGPGVGGHCIPVDPRYLTHRARELGQSLRLVELAQEVNAGMPAYVVDRVAELLGSGGSSLPEARVMLLGVAYKPEVNDVRESPAVEITRLLRKEGAMVAYSDPHVEEFVVDGEPVLRENDPVDGAAQADGVLILTPHRAFDIPAVCVAAKAVLDTRGVAPLELATRM